MTQGRAPTQAGVYWTPIVVVLLVGLVMLVGNLVQSPPMTQAERDEQRIEQIRSGEKFHCEMFGVPSDEAQLAGYQCP